jgi:hypothetical protein
MEMTIQRTVIFLTLALLATTGSSLLAQTAFTSPPPVAITSCGQSPDAYTVSLLSKRAKIERSRR